MKLQHSFVVDTSADSTWRTLLDLDHLAQSVPGGRLSRRAGDPLYAGALTLAVAGSGRACRGSLRNMGSDGDARRLALRLDGREEGGPASAAGMLAVGVDETADGVRVTLSADLAVTGQRATAGESLRAGELAFRDFGARLERTLAPALDWTEPRSALAPARPPWAPLVGSVGVVALIVAVAARRSHARRRGLSVSIRDRW